jgi:hypothetical protein
MTGKKKNGGFDPRAILEFFRNPLEIRKFLIRAIIVLSVLLALELVFHFFLAPTMRITRLSLLGDDIRISDQELLSWMGYQDNPYYFSFDEEDMETILSEHPRIRSAMVQKVFPDKLEITVDARKPLVLAFFEISAQEGPSPALGNMLVDEEGVIIAVNDPEPGLSLPVLSGLKVAEAKEGSTFPAMFLPFLRDLYNLRQQNPQGFSMISELVLVGREKDNFDVWCIPLGYRSKALLTSKLTSEKINQLLAVFDLIEAQGLEGEMGEIDFRTDEVIYGSIKG